MVGQGADNGRHDRARHAVAHRAPSFGVGLNRGGDWADGVPVHDDATDGAAASCRRDSVLPLGFIFSGAGSQEREAVRYSSATVSATTGTCGARVESSGQLITKARSKGAIVVLLGSPQDPNRTQ